MDKLRIDIKKNKSNDIKFKLNKIKNFDLTDVNLDKLSLNFKKLSYILNLINYSTNINFLNKKNFLNILKNDIYISTEVNLSNKDIFSLLKKSIQNKHSLNKINKIKTNKINMNGGSMNDIFDWNKNTKRSTKILDLTSFFLDILGLIPLYGIVFDGSNVLLSLVRGDILNAAFSLISLIPIIGMIGPSLKIGYKLSKKQIPSNENLDDSSESSEDESESSEDESESSESSE